MESQLSGHHQRSYQRLYQHPIPHNLHWRDVWSMLGAMVNTVTVEDSMGNLTVARNGKTLSLYRPRGNDLTDEKELMQVRRFLERSDAAAAPSAMIGSHLLVVIDHSGASIHSTDLRGSIPQRVTPYDPFGSGGDLHYNQDDSNDRRNRKQRHLYEAIARILRGAQRIVMFGTGPDGDSAREQFLLHLQQHHSDLAERIIDSIAGDGRHLAEDQLLAMARELFAAARIAPSFAAISRF